MNRTKNEAVETAVLTYLAGGGAAVAARTAGMSTAELARVSDRYRAAGLSTLDPDPCGWAQIDVEFSDYAAAEHTFHQELWPALGQQQWWFVRKNPNWRLRYLQLGAPEVPDDLRDVLNTMVAKGTLRRWWKAIYEPETAAFGGTAGLTAVNTIHTADSAGLFSSLDARDTEALSRPVASLMLLAHLMRAAGLEWSEQGDVWARVQVQRPEAPLTDQDASELAGKAHRVLSTDLGVLMGNDSRFASLNAWAAGLHAAGSHLAGLVDDGRLQTGLRTILARTIVFCWNRAGFTIEQQAVWAMAARRAILG
jgi:thiopeptide-type bacteriocin biosynthesis protein